MYLIQKTFILTIESFGVGEAPDAGVYGDKNANTLGHVADYTGGLDLPAFSRLGLGNLTFIKGLPRDDETIAYYGKSRQISDSKDSLSGHWEITGYNYPSLYHSDPEGFFPQFIEKLENDLGKKCLFNQRLNADQIIDRYYYDHITEKSFIVFYNPGDMTLYIAAHPDVADEDKLKEIVQIMHDSAEYYGFIRSCGLSVNHNNKKNVLEKKRIIDLSKKPLSTTLLGTCKSAGIPVYFIGKKQNIFEDREFTEIILAPSDRACMEKLNEVQSGIKYSNEHGQALIYCVLSDINTITAKGKDIKAYSDAVKGIDDFLQKFIRSMNTSDLIMITSSNGNDPSFTESMHTREYLPILAYSRVLGVRSVGNLGVRRTLSDIAETISDIYSLDSHYGGDSFWNYMLSQI
ncbi:MAG: hypothetical protein OEV66_03900 [Spirochaetia bacterium]|nr:hypothetical protein [Spirochaetia bacterium]